MFEKLKLNQIEDYFLAQTQRPQKGVYFYRIIGYDEPLLIFLRKYQTKAQKRGNYINQTIKNPDAGDVQQLSTIIEKNFKIDKEQIKRESSKWLKILSSTQINLISEAIYEVLTEISKTETNTNILKNAYIKFLYWLKYKFENSIKYIGQDDNPKILYEGEIGKYEVYMLRILSLVGCDIIYINFLNEETYMKTDRRGEYSYRIIKEKREMPKTHYSKIDLNQIEEKNQQIEKIKASTIKINTNTWVKSDYIEELYKENHERKAETEGYNNIFIKYIGIENPDEYNNKIYTIKKRLEESGKKYLIIENGIPMPKPEEISKYRFNYRSKDDITVEILKRININNKEEINQAIKGIILNLIQNTEEQNLTKIYNTVLKIACWIERYGTQIWGEYNTKLPAIIYWGDLSQVEATFISIMSKLPVDILYINPNKNNVKTFEKVEIEEKGKIIELKNSSEEKMQFPNKEIKLRVSTVAYQAEKELDTILYQDTGMYRDKQFKTCETITLKTTYEEIGILWEQEAKYRPGFKTERGKVTVPNIFAKISGVKDGNINEYLKKIQDMITTQTIIIKHLPYIKNDTPNEFYSQSHKFVTNEKINIEEIKKSKQYKYNFLNSSTQDYILSKIQEMINLKLIFKDDPEISRKIVSILLNIDKNILKIIQQIDFTKELPKIIIIDTSENLASWQDCILLIYLNLIGFDIIIFTPTGYQNIEKYIEPNLYEEYQIGNYVYNINMPKFKKAKEKSKKTKSLKDFFRRRN